MTAHTQGAWIAAIEGVDLHGADEHHIHAGEHMATVAIIPLSCHASTHGEEGSTKITRKEAIANARLIASAPDLLAALKALVYELSDSDDEGLIEHAPGMVAARAAIAKATQP